MKIVNINIFFLFFSFESFALQESDLDSAESNNSITLENTKLGQAILNENIEDYRKALKNLESKSPSIFFDSLQVEDVNQNNLLHLMARVQTSKQDFAGEMLRLIIYHFEIGYVGILQKVNKQGMTPVEEAEKAGNLIAFEYLTSAGQSAEMIMGNDIRRDMATQDMIQEVVIQLQQSHMHNSILSNNEDVLFNWVQRSNSSKMRLGIVTLLLSGLVGVYVDPLAFLITGWSGWACYQAFAENKFISKTKKLKRSF